MVSSATSARCAPSSSRSIPRAGGRRPERRVQRRSRRRRRRVSPGQHGDRRPCREPSPRTRSRVIARTATRLERARRRRCVWQRTICSARSTSWPALPYRRRPRRVGPHRSAVGPGRARARRIAGKLERGRGPAGGRSEPAGSRRREMTRRSSLRRGRETWFGSAPAPRDLP